MKNQYLVFRMGAQLRTARVLTVIISDLMKTTGSLLLVELSRIVIWGGAHGAEVMMTLAVASRASGVTSFLAKTLTRYTPKELKCKICMPKILNTLLAVKVRKIRENYHLKRKIVICPRLMWTIPMRLEGLIFYISLNMSKITTLIFKWNLITKLTFSRWLILAL